jgi:hypothetical protein
VTDAINIFRYTIPHHVHFNKYIISSFIRPAFHVTTSLLFWPDTFGILHGFMLKFRFHIRVWKYVGLATIVSGGAQTFRFFIITCFANPVLYFCNVVLLSCLPVLHQLSSHFGKQNGTSITLYDRFPMVLGSNLGRETSYSSWCSLWGFPVRSSKYRGSISIRPRSFPSKSFPIHYYNRSTISRYIVYILTPL